MKTKTSPSYLSRRLANWEHGCHGFVLLVVLVFTSFFYQSFVGFITNFWITRRLFAHSQPLLDDRLVFSLVAKLTKMPTMSCEEDLLLMKANKKMADPKEDKSEGFLTNYRRTSHCCRDSRT